MKIYLLSLGAGILVGVIYSLLNVRSPAPPLVALVGLLGILAGEQIVPIAKQIVQGEGLDAAGRQARCAPHVFGLLPRRQAVEARKTTGIAEKAS
ncbi:XapX domain-containing protein [Bradyrhizobium sp. Arg68]|uniref:XapX domain-containing protein n=1 Tax=Bradyrhizobium ivorense TaxID=2511166 RepID=UPI001E39904D|nr:XapX domain-containing protein [Bradyrhizobium ivorense]MCC8937526.1 XapX domain-containing protein [Bradyrhizobium ivorense]